MAQPFDALHFREIMGRALRGSSGPDLAFTVSPIKPDTPSRKAAQIVEAVRRHLVELLDHGEIYYVSSEITQLLLDQAVGMSKTIYHFEPGDFPTRLGMIYFDGLVPMPTILAKSRMQPLRGLVWGQLAQNRGEPGVEEDAPSFIVPGSYSEEHPTQIVGKIVYSVVDSIQAGQWRDRRFERSQDFRARHAHRWNFRHWLPIDYGTRFNAETISEAVDNTTWGNDTLSDEEQAQDDADSYASVGLIIRLLWVWTQFIQTEIVGHHKLDSSNHDKVVAREGRPPADVRIVTLRRYASVPVQNQVEVDWQYRWKVREHYRNQRVGPGRAFIRRTLVREHWKGPEDRPQAHQDTIQALVR